MFCVDMDFSEKSVLNGRYTNGINIDQHEFHINVTIELLIRTMKQWQYFYITYHHLSYHGIKIPIFQHLLDIESGEERDVSSSMKTELKQYMEIFPNWTDCMINFSIWLHVPPDHLDEEYRRMWCEQKDLRFVDMFLHVYKTLPWKILLNRHTYFEWVLNRRACTNHELDLRKMIRMRTLRFKMRVVLHVATLFSYLMKRIYAPGKPIVKKLAIDFYSHSISTQP